MDWLGEYFLQTTTALDLTLGGLIKVGAKPGKDLQLEVLGEIQSVVACSSVIGGKVEIEPTRVDEADLGADIAHRPLSLVVCLRAVIGYQIVIVTHGMMMNEVGEV